MTKIYLRDLKKRLCVAGAKRFCEQHNIDWSVAIREGVDVEVLLKIDDHMVKAFVEEVINEQSSRRP